MREETSEVVDQIRGIRALRLVRLIDDAGLDRPVEIDPAPAAVVAPYRWLLGRVGDGIRLTQAGYLPPSVVTEAMTTLGWLEAWFGKGNREDMTPPVLKLRESAQRLGLVRKQRGYLLVTKIGRALTDDPVALWWHLAERLPDARTEPERHAGVLYLLTLAAGRPRDDGLLAEGMTALGWTEGDARQPVSPSSVASATSDTRGLFDRLGLLPGRERRDGSDTPPSTPAIRLAHAALLGRSGPEPMVSTRPGPQAVELTVTIAGVAPAVWRRVVVPESLTLHELHNVLQTALGWHNYHLHQYEIAGVLYGDVDDFVGELGEEDVVTIGQVAERAQEFSYAYDFGDGWRHDIRIDRVLDFSEPRVARVVAGERACPPEDSGGPGGYARLISVLADPSHGDHQDLQRWLRDGFDPEAFDPEATNEHLALFDRQDRRRLAVR